MRQFDYLSMFVQLLIVLNQPRSEKKDDELHVPFVAERLLLYMLRDTPGQYGHISATQATVTEAINRCWSATNAVFFKEGMPIETPSLFIRSAYIGQVSHQIGAHPSKFSRQMLLAETLEPNSKLAIYLSTRARLPLDTFLDLAAITLPHFDNDKPWLTADYLKTLADNFGQATVSSFFDAFSFRLPDIPTDLRNTVGSISADEWFQPTPLYRTPCVWLGGAIVPFGRPSIRRYLETFVADAVDQCSDPQVRQAWEKKIQRYVFETAAQLESLDAEVLDEDRMRCRFALGTGLCCDVAIIFPKAIVCIEVKTKNLSSNLPAAATARELKSKLKATVLHADEQLLNVITALQEHPQLKALPVYSLIVTSTELFLGPADALVSSQWAARGLAKPLVVNVDDLDWLIEGHRIGKFQIASALHDFHSRIAINPFALFSLSQLRSEENYAVATPKHLCGLVEKRITRIIARANT